MYIYKSKQIRIRQDLSKGNKSRNTQYDYLQRYGISVSSYSQNCRMTVTLIVNILLYYTCFHYYDGSEQIQRTHSLQQRLNVSFWRKLFNT